MYILPVTREIIKTEGFNISFGTKRTLMHVNTYTDYVMNVVISDISVYTGRAKVQEGYHNHRPTHGTTRKRHKLITATRQQSDVTKVKQPALSLAQ